MLVTDTLKQQQHLLSWNGAVAGDLLLVALQGTESLSSPYDYQIRSLTQLTESQLVRWHGKAVSCRIGDGSREQQQRFLHGVVTRIAYAQRTRSEAECILTLEPSLSLLKMGRQTRVWQNISVPDLVSQLFSEHGINQPDRQLHGDYPKREYCIQYREADFNFIQRLLEEEGIYYFFRHSATEHTLVLVDHPASHDPIPGDKLGWHHHGSILTPGSIDRWESTALMLPAGMALRGFNAQQATAIEDAQSAGESDGRVANVTFMDITPQGDRTRLSRMGQNAMNAREANVQFFDGSVNAHWLSCGEIFTFTGHPTGNGQYRIQALHIEAANAFDGNPGSCACSLQAMNHEQRWFPEQKTPIPWIPGILTATVVGPSSEEIHTDELGRIKIQFPWDKDNQNNDTSSCWVQVAQPWAGGRFGAQFIPRVGSEVLVSFIQGHPDFPLVTGTVYNGQNKPPFELPAEKNETGFLTRSSPNGSPDDGHRLSFNDKKGEELMTVIAQRDLSVTVKNNATSTIAANRSTELTKGNDRLCLKEGDLRVSLENGNMTQQVSGDLVMELKDGNYSLNVAGGSGTIKTDKKFILESTQSVELKVGNNKISISPGGISVNGTMITIEGSGTAELKGAMTTVSGSGMTQVSGGIINIG